jgi:nitrate reductase NapE component
MKIPFRWWWVPTFLSVLIVVIPGVAIVKASSEYSDQPEFLFIVVGTFPWVFVLLVVTWVLSAAVHNLRETARLKKEKGGR